MIRRASQLFLPTLREAPADAEAISHKLLVRGAFIRQVSAGVWTFLPLGWRVHEKVVGIIREEMDAIGAQELFMPVLTPAELWKATGRYDITEVFKLRDRNDREFVLPMTHEETVTLPRARDPVVPRPAADALPLPDEGARRAAPARRPDPRPRVHHEGLVFVRPRRGGARQELPAAQGGARPSTKKTKRWRETRTGRESRTASASGCGRPGSGCDRPSPIPSSTPSRIAVAATAVAATGAAGLLAARPAVVLVEAATLEADADRPEHLPQGAAARAGTQ